MKILLLGTAYPLRGGIAHYNALLAQALGKRHHVETITFKRQYPRIFFPGSTQQETGDQMHGEAAPQLVDSVNPLNWVRVGAEVRRRKPDLIILKYWIPFFGPCFGTIARLARHRTGTRVLIICDNVLPHERRPFDTLFTRYAFSAADFFIVQSAAVERDLRSFWPHAVYRNVPHPLYTFFGDPVPKDAARRALGISAERVILFFGYIRRYKGLHLLLDAMKEVDPALGIHCVVAGEFYDDEGAYQDQIDALGLRARVTIRAGYLPNDQVGAYVSAADAVVLPYLSATQSGIAQIAYNFDTPVLAADVGGLAEVVRNEITGLVVPSGNPSFLARAIERFFREGLAARFIPAIQKEKERYTWDSLTTAIEDLVRGA